MRISSMDFLRGFAILLMYWDHWLWINGKGLFEGRLITRLAEPLFALLLGYFLSGRSYESLKKRFLHLIIAALISNIFFYQLVGHFDILASFIIAYIVILLKFPLKWLGIVGLILNIWDLPWFDYGPGLVLWQIALGKALREKKHLGILLLVGTTFGIFQPGGDVLAWLFTYPGLLLLKLAEIFPNISFNILNYLGRHPLIAYVIQFPILWAMKTWLL